jgi:uncharacterized protein (DUF2461 family)
MDDLFQLPEWGPRFQAILTAPKDFLSEAFLDQASTAEFEAALVRFYEACVPLALHTPTVRRRAALVRHALSHLMRCVDPMPRKIERCLAADGTYHVPGLGPTFWSAVCQGLDPVAYPAWTPTVLTGLDRLGLLCRRASDRPGRTYAAIRDAYGQLRTRAPKLTALHCDHFLTLVSTMRGRELLAVSPAGEPTRSQLTPHLPSLIHQQRARTPLRRRLKQAGRALEECRRELEAGLSARDGPRIAAALAKTEASRSAAIDGKADAETLVMWTDRLWRAEDPYEALNAFWCADPIPGAGLWLPVATLHLKDPQQFHPWSDTARQGFAILDDSADQGEPAAERYHLFNEGSARLCEVHQLHPLEAPDLLSAVPAEPYQVGSPPTHESTRFGGFCADTFRFFTELEANNRRDWMEQQRDRYRFAVRDPLIELCRALVERYVEPVLRGSWGWDLETSARSGRAVTSICKNDYGRSVPYHTALWITFYRRGSSGGAASRRRREAQFFVRLDAAGLHYGFRLGHKASEVARLFRRNVTEQADLLWRALTESGAVADCQPANGDLSTLAGPDDLRTWAAGPQPVLAKTVPAGSPLLLSDELVGEVLLTFDRLLPVFACAVEPGMHPILARRAGVARLAGCFTEADFRRATFLNGDWLRRARALLDLKRQLILQGVPGTGKTHVARCLAQLLTGGCDEAVRLVQFHPAYSYEEFVEGIKVRSVEVNGRHDVTYPVEDGLLCAFAAEAASHPAEPYVLLIDEINRGNLPRIFGELLYLLEYREQTVGLPYSRRGFRLPANLYLLGTMNAADRSVALVDQALRRRFSFLEMPPDADVLAAWFQSHPPAAGSAFAVSVVGLFERLNDRLRSDLGPTFRIGHSYFMVPDFDEARLRVVWEHQVEPLLEEYFTGQPGKAAGYGLDDLIADRPGGPARRKRQTVEVGS